MGKQQRGERGLTELRSRRHVTRNITGRKIMEERVNAGIVSIGRDDLISSVLRIGEGRGFIVAANDTAYVITATHCLPFLPPPHLARFREEETYPRLIGPLGADPSISAACVFADPVADIAVLGPPDSPAPGAEHDQYAAFLETLPPFDIAAPPPRSRIQLRTFADEPPRFIFSEVSFPAHLLSIEGVWLDCTARYLGGPLVIEPEELAAAGMSGSPVISATGAAIGVMSTSNWAACLTNGLPGWLLRALACAS
jgi:hypothetical protein